MIHIVHLITDLNAGGAEIMLYKLLSGMDHSRFQNTVISLQSKGEIGAKIEKLGIPVHELNMNKNVIDLAKFVRLVRLLHHEKPHILQTWLYHADLMGLLAGKLTGIPAIYWNVRCSYMQLDNYSQVTGWIVKILAKLSGLPQAIISNSQIGIAYHQKLGYKPQRWAVIPNGFDLTTFQPDSTARDILRDSLGIEPTALLIGSVGRYDPVKDYATFIQAANQVAQYLPDVYFLLAGLNLDDQNEELSAWAMQGPYRERFHFLGKRQDISQIMAALDVFSLQSIGEGFPNVVGEAMACGVPCTVTDVGDCAYIVGETGLVVPPKNPERLAEAWEELLGLSRNQRQQRGSLARQRMAELFSIESVVRRYEAFYAND